jgi:hypothetical protein
MGMSMGESPQIRAMNAGRRRRKRGGTMKQMPMARTDPNMRALNAS